MLKRGRYPLTTKDPYDVGGVLSSLSDTEVCDYLKDLRHYIRKMPRFPRPRSPVGVGRGTPDATAVVAAPTPPGSQEVDFSEKKSSYENKRLRYWDHIYEASFPQYHRQPWRQRWVDRLRDNKDFIENNAPGDFHDVIVYDADDPMGLERSDNEDDMALYESASGSGSDSFFD